MSNDRLYGGNGQIDKEVIATLNELRLDRERLQGTEWARKVGFTLTANTILHGNEQHQKMAAGILKGLQSMVDEILVDNGLKTAYIEGIYDFMVIANIWGK